MEYVIPAFNDDKEVSWLEPTENGKLTPRFSYLQDFVDGK
jgi:hypothetical protein